MNVESCILFDSWENTETEKIYHYLALICWSRISSCGTAFLVSKFLISFAVTSLSFIVKMLGCLLCFLLRAITDQSHFPYHKRCPYLYLIFSQCHQKTSYKFQLFLHHLSKLATFNNCHFVVIRFIFFFNEKWRYCFLE